MGRIFLQVVAFACLVALVLTDLDITQRLLLTGVMVPIAVALWWEHLNAK